MAQESSGEMDAAYNPFADSDEDEGRDEERTRRGEGSGRAQRVVAAQGDDDEDEEEGAMSSIEVLEVPLLAQEDGPESAEAPGKPWCSRRRVCLCAMTCGVFLLAVLGLAIFVGVKLFGVYKKCDASGSSNGDGGGGANDSCVKLESIELFGTGTNSKPHIDIPFNVKASIDLPSFSWVSLMVDHVEVEAFHNDSLLFRTNALTPVFTDANGSSRKRWLDFGKSAVRLAAYPMMHVDNADDQAALRVANVAWLMVNELGLTIDVHVRAQVGINLFLIPFRKHIDQRISFHVDAAKPSRNSRLSRSSSSSSSASSNLLIDLVSVDFHETANPRTDLSFNSTVSVTISDTLPELRANFTTANLGRLDVYASNESFVPIMANLVHNPDVGLVAEAKIAPFHASRTFALEASVLSSSQNMSLATMQTVASGYVVAHGGHSSFMYVKTNADHQAVDTSFLARVLDKMDPVRVELVPLSARALQDPIHTATRQSLVHEVRVENITSSQTEGRVDLKTFLTANVTGFIPEVVMDVASLGEHTIEISVPNGTIFDPRRGVSATVNFQRPGLLWDQLLAANYDANELKPVLVGSSRDDVTLISAILRNVSYALTNETPNQAARSLNRHAIKQPELRLKRSRDEASDSIDLYARSSTTEVAAGIHVLFSSLNDTLPFRVRWAPRCVGGDPVVISNARHKVRMELSVPSMELGPKTRNTVQVDFSALFASLKSTGPAGAGLDFGCATAGTPCDPDGAGIRAEIAPVQFALALPNIRFNIRELPGLRLLPVPGATLEVSTPDLSTFMSSGTRVSSTVAFETSTSEALRNVVQAEVLSKSFRGDSSYSLLSAAIGYVGAALLSPSNTSSGNQVNASAADSDNVYAEDVSLDVFSGPDHVKLSLDCTPSPRQAGQLRLDVPALELVLGDVGTLKTSAWVFANTGLVSDFQVDYQVDANTAPAVARLIGSLVNKLSSDVHLRSADEIIDVRLNLTAVSTRDRAPAEYSLEILGGRTSPGAARVLELNVPCVLPNLCPAVPKDLNGAPYTLIYDLLGSLALDARFFRRLQLRAPPIAFALNAGVHNRMIDFSVPAVDIKVDSSVSHLVSVPFTMTLRDVQLLRNALQTLLDSVVPISFRVFVPQERHEQSMLPALLRDADVMLKFEAASPDGRPVPTPKAKQWWFPLASTGAWRLVYTTSTTASFEVNMLLHNPSPVTAVLPDMDCKVAYLVGGADAATPREALFFGHGHVNAGDLILPGNESSRILSTLVAKQETSGHGDKPPASCSKASISDPATRHNCVISTLLEKMVGKTETHILVAAGFRNPEGSRIQVNFEAVFLEGETGKAIRPYVPPPRFAKDLPSGANSSAMDEFVGVFNTVNVDGWSTAWQSLVEQGIDLAVQVVLHNPFAFPIWVDAYALNLTFDDPTGEYLYYLPSNYAPQLNIPLVTDLSATGLDMVIPGNATMSLPETTVRLLERRVELACRLYNAAEKVQELCASVPGGIFKVGVGSFVWTQKLSIYNVTAVGSNACLYEPACMPALLPAPPPASAKWSLQGTASMTSPGVLLLTKGETDEVAAAWLQEKVMVGDGFDASFDFELKDTSTFGGGDGIAFVVQRDGGPQAMGERCSNSPCNGYTGIPGPSFAVVLYRSTTEHVELHVLVNGQSKPEVGFAASPLLPSAADGKRHNLRVFYSRADRKVYIYLDGVWQLTVNVWEPEQVDQGQCSAGGAKAQKSACVDLDAIAKDSGRAWMGFTASTGIVMSSVQRVQNVAIRNILASLESSVIVEQGLVIGEAKRTVKMTVDLRDSCGAPIRRALSKTPEVLIEDPHGGRFTPIDVQADPQGLIHVKLVPQMQGTFHVLARYGGDTSAPYRSLGSFLIASE
ncbi:Hypothetical Protein FCC1311_054582 [Hondaea fermentalgiana]|uniref:Uncharacterized protein n=1 Tax=Hondaea fermentalgiana TaxID=2315210 RepID=A0A2R5GE94_9STRA|nr:Hypothetical Protein FCC1311_054582 [Hondaea fermentalgiana]|eukprot:GBG29236.1 Hypothetical Protein FCC1311_054582 [Hondaea fermentalgiana]